MAIARVNVTTQTADNFSGDATAVITIPATTIGNLVVVAIQYNTTSRTISSVTGGATFASYHRKVSDGGGENGVIDIYAGIATSSVTTVTVVLSGNDTFGSDSRLSVFEYSGCADPVAESGTSVDGYAAGAATTLSLAAVSCSAADTVFIAVRRLSGSSGGWTEDTDFTNQANATTGIADRVQNASSTAQGYDPSWVTTRGYLAALVAFQGATPTAPALMGQAIF